MENMIQKWLSGRVFYHL